MPLYTRLGRQHPYQFEGPIAEKCGLLKMDFLGLRTLTTGRAQSSWRSRTRELRYNEVSKNQPPPV